MRPGDRPVVVVGAGMAGLAAADRLRRTGRSVIVLEREERVGGRTSTLHEGGFALDLCASAVSTSAEETCALISQMALDDQADRRPTVIGLVRDGQVHELRSGVPLDFVRTRLLRHRSKYKILAMAHDTRRLDRFVTTSSLSKLACLVDETTTAWATRRLGNEWLDYLIEPIAAGFFRTAPERLSALSCQVALSALFSGGQLFTFTSGIDTLARTIAATVEVRTNSTVTRAVEEERCVQVTWNDHEGNAHRTEADGCVVAVDAPTVPSLLPSLTPGQRGYLHDVHYASTVHVFLKLRAPAPHRALVTFVPRVEEPGLALIVYQADAPGRIPNGRAVLNLCFREEWSRGYGRESDDSVQASALLALGTALPALAAKVVPDIEGYHIHRKEHALIARPPGGFQALGGFTASLDPTSRIQLAGDYTSMSTINNSVAAGLVAADRLAARLEATHYAKDQRS